MDKQELVDMLRDAANDEEKAVLEYSQLANDADDLGLGVVSARLRSISDDEFRHKILLNEAIWDIKAIMHEEPTSDTIELSGKMIEVPISRQFPQTYGDWSQLAGDIKDRMPEASWGLVNNLLQVIYEGGPEAEEAKRWLVKKAGELGIT